MVMHAITCMLMVRRKNPFDAPKCRHCGTLMVGANSNRMWCSRECRYLALEFKPKVGLCGECGVELWRQDEPADRSGWQRRPLFCEPCLLERRRCRDLARRVGPPAIRPCGVCGAPVDGYPANKKFCSPECRAAHDVQRRRNNDRGRRKWPVVGPPEPKVCECGSHFAHRQRSFCEECALERKRERRRRKKARRRAREGRGPRPVACAWCVIDFLAANATRKFCSHKCRHLAGLEKRSGPRNCADCGLLIRMHIPVEGCGQGGPGSSKHRFCESCGLKRRRESAREARRRREYRKRGAAKGQAPYTRAQLAERDKWKCHICGGRVLKSAKVPHPRAATVDHLIPISAGGVDGLENVALAHFLCNTRRGTGGEAQLRLTG